MNKEQYTRINVSIPVSFLAIADEFCQKHAMNRSEFLRAAARAYMKDIVSTEMRQAMERMMRGEKDK